MKSYVLLLIVLIAFFGSLYAGSFKSKALAETLQRALSEEVQTERINTVDDIDIMKQLHANLLKQNELLRKKILSSERLNRKQHYQHAALYAAIFIALLWHDGVRKGFRRSKNAASNL